jgi:hypothetical protein
MISGGSEIPYSGARLAQQVTRLIQCRLDLLAGRMLWREASSHALNLQNQPLSTLK